MAFVRGIHKIFLKSKVCFKECYRPLTCSGILSSSNMQQIAEKTFLKAVEAVSPDNMVQSALQYKGGSHFQVMGEAVAVSQNIHILGVGKAASGMVRAAEDILKDQIKGGIAVVPKGLQADLQRRNLFHLLPRGDSKVTIFEGAADNSPDEQSVCAAQEIQEFVMSLNEDDILLTLITGGGSALLSLPVSPVTLTELVTVTRLLSKAGASISELNMVRKNIEVLKGGGLLQLAHPAQVISLILSDIIGDPVHLIASGPTSLSPDGTDKTSPQDIFLKYGVTKEVPLSVMKVLEEDKKSSCIRSLAKTDVDDPSHPPKATNILVGTNSKAVKAAVLYCEQQGFHTLPFTSSLTGEAKIIGSDFAALAQCICTYFDSNTRNALPSTFANGFIGVYDFIDTALGRSICILTAGEPTVTVTGSGIGGRNQEMALAFSQTLKSLEEEYPVLSQNYNIHFLSGGTDGQDGPTDAAGAHGNSTIGGKTVNGETVQTFLMNNDSHTFYSRLDGGNYLLKTGLTGTNVMDIQILLISKQI